MKNKRPEILAVVVGRSRRCYARTYKMTKCLDYFKQHYFEKEVYKAREEGFVPVGIDEERPNDGMIVYRIRYEAI